MGKKIRLGFVALVFILGSNLRSLGATQQVLYSFTDGGDGGYPQSGLVFDSTGNLYGTTELGGEYNSGAVFELSPSGGTWTQTVLYSFTGGADGNNPTTALVIDEEGNLYGTAGKNVFELKRVQDRWKFLVLYTFPVGPVSSLIADRSHHLLGTTQYGGTNDNGTVFALQHSKSGWTAITLYSFGTGTDGNRPTSGVVLDGHGRIYGETPGGGHGRGTVFVLTHSDAGWKERILYYFEGGYDGTTPIGGLAQDSIGNVYGMTQAGGTNNQGTVFELSCSYQGCIKTVIYNISGDRPVSNSGLVLGPDGNLYGALSGTIFELSFSGGGWVETQFFNFNGQNGNVPNGGMTFDHSGSLYGTTANGGVPFSAGVAYEITP